KEKLTSGGGMEVQTSDLKQVRKASGLTQAQLAQLTGGSRQTSIATEPGDYAPRVYLALRIARALDPTVEEIVSLQEEARGRPAAERSLAPTHWPTEPPASTIRPWETNGNVRSSSGRTRSARSSRPMCSSPSASSSPSSAAECGRR